MTIKISGVAFLIVLSLNSGAGPAISPEDRVLLRIDKSEAARLSPAVGETFQALEELKDGWLVETTGSALRQARREGVRFDLLDERPEEKTYFLVSTPQARDSEELADYGPAIRLDAETTLFRTDGREAREILPARFSLKRLSRDAGSSALAAGAAPSGPGLPFWSTFRPTTFDPSIRELVDLVSEPALGVTIQDLERFKTRYANTASCDSAASYLLEAFSRLGLSAESDPFTFGANAYPTRNIVATLEGKTRPDLIVLLGAHFDSTSNEAATRAPGADDNASGTAAVLEIARIFSGRSFDFTVKFICFSAEEWGLYGSKHYAGAARARGEKILAVLNLDMIAYTDRLPEDLDLIVNSRSAWLFNRYAICASLYAPLGLLKVLNPNMRYSDHAPFWDQGYSAVLGIEDVDVPNPYYHKATDLITTLNMNFAAAVTKLTLAVAAGLAQPVVR